jgi:glycosyltransferase involved in cell wall biosynthesis
MSREKGESMRVLHIVPAAFGANGVVGGAERYAFELARHMAEKTPTTLLTFGDTEGEERHGELRLRMVKARWRVRGQQSNPFSGDMFPEISRADVVHCHQQHVVASSSAAVAGRLLGRRVVVSELGGGGWDISGYISTDRWFHKHLHISEYSRQFYGHSGKPWAHVIYGGVDTEKFCPDASVRRENVAVYVGRLLPHKGIDDLVQALPDGMRLEIIGKPYNAEYVERLHSLAVGKDVLFRHGCSDAELVNAYRRAACVVLPSVYRDCFGGVSGVPELLGQTLLEGMACGAPAICTDVASMPEVVVDNVTGFVVPPNDPASLREKLCWLLRHPAEREKLGRAGRARVEERFRWSCVVDECLKLYAS